MLWSTAERLAIPGCGTFSPAPWVTSCKPASYGAVLPVSGATAGWAGARCRQPAALGAWLPQGRRHHASPPPRPASVRLPGQPAAALGGYGRGAPWSGSRRAGRPSPGRLPSAPGSSRQPPPAAAAPGRLRMFARPAAGSARTVAGLPGACARSRRPARVYREPRYHQAPAFCSAGSMTPVAQAGPLTMMPGRSRPPAERGKGGTGEAAEIAALI
jgi:hypothetical protein